MRTLAFLFFLTLLSAPAFAQNQFIAPAVTIPKNDAIAFLQDGTKIEGKVTKGSAPFGRVKQINIRDASGTKHELKPEDIRELRVKMSDWQKLRAADDASSSAQTWAKTDDTELWKREYAVWYQVKLPGKKEKYNLLQLLNPGFDHKIKVYQNPAAGETGGISVGGVQATGGEDRSYFVVKEGEDETIKLKKSEYKKQGYDQLFGDCPEFLQYWGESKVNYSDLATHVSLYDDMCGKK